MFRKCNYRKIVHFIEYCKPAQWGDSKGSTNARLAFRVANGLLHVTSLRAFSGKMCTIISIAISVYWVLQHFKVTILLFVAMRIRIELGFLFYSVEMIHLFYTKAHSLLCFVVIFANISLPSDSLLFLSRSEMVFGMCKVCAHNKADIHKCGNYLRLCPETSHQNCHFYIWIAFILVTISQNCWPNLLDANVKMTVCISNFREIHFKLNEMVRCCSCKSNWNVDLIWYCYQRAHRDHSSWMIQPMQIQMSAYF